MAYGEAEGLPDWTLPHLLDVARAVTKELMSRLADPLVVDRLPRIPEPPVRHPADDWGLHADVVEDLDLEEALAQAPVEMPSPRGTFLELHSGVEELGRMVEVARTALAGHTARLFEDHASRQEVFGIPGGKSAYRNATEYLREHLGISRRQARSRIERARGVMPVPSLDRTHVVPPRWPALSRAAADADLDPAAVDAIAATLTGARAGASEPAIPPGDVDALIEDGERTLVRSARVLDPDALGRVCAHWRVRFEALVHPDGAEPTEAQRRVAQGLFYRGRRTGLHHWALAVTDGQHEILKTLVSAASGVRGAPSSPVGASAAAQRSGDAPGRGGAGRGGAGHDGAGRADAPHEAADQDAGCAGHAGGVHVGDRPGGVGRESAGSVVCTEDPGRSIDRAEDARGGLGAADPEGDLDRGLEENRPDGLRRRLSTDTASGDGADEDEFANPGVLWERGIRAAADAEARTAAERARLHAAAVAGESVGWTGLGDDPDDLEDRTRPQRELDALVGALTGALALTASPGAADGRGGARPHVLVTIDYRTLLEAGRRSPSAPIPPPSDPYLGTGPSGRVLRQDRVSRASYAGEIDPAVIRAWACDAELIPVVLGGEGEVLDLGRTRRLFPPRLRRAITARDGGCAAPGCTIPAPWCEAHHIEHWEHGGPTSVDNGVLLCSHHHHAVHAEAWSISMRNGVPWFVPAAYRDPRRRPRRNTVWRGGPAA
ncbi:MAG TPA: HNH endonuclease signature motif containing protein [Citricoccus sp.]